MLITTLQDDAIEFTTLSTRLCCNPCPRALTQRLIDPDPTLCTRVRHILNITNVTTAQNSRSQAAVVLLIFLSRIPAGSRRITRMPWTEVKTHTVRPDCLTPSLEADTESRLMTCGCEVCDNCRHRQQGLSFVAPDGGSFGPAATALETTLREKH